MRERADRANLLQEVVACAMPALVATFVVSLGGSGVRADTTSLSLGAVRDNTLVEDSGGALSNGSGQHLFAGRTLQSFQGMPDRRRAVVAFEVAGTIPAGSTILSASLVLHVSKELPGDVVFALHRLTSDWGEGASDAPLDEGMGTSAEPGDATWLHAFAGGAPWTAPGGDFGEASVAQTVSGTGAHVWSSAALVADVQAMLDDPAADFGWIVVGDESTTPSAKRFDSREHPEEGRRPALVVEYTDATPIEHCQGIDGVDSLEVNGDDGAGGGHRVTVSATGPIELSIERPGGRGNGKFLAHLNAGPPSGSTFDTLPAGLGVTCFSFLLARGAMPVANFNAIGRESRVGESRFFGTPIPDPERAPVVFLSLPGGDPNLPPGSVFTLQAVIFNPDSSGSKKASVTNGIEIHVE